MLKMEDFTDIVEQLGRLTGRVEEALKHVATRKDVAVLSSKLDAHLELHKEDKVLMRRVRLLAISALIAGIPTLATALITALF